MAYGVKRGVKAPGEFGFSDIAGLALAGSAGIISALVTDYQQKGEISALYTLNRWADSFASVFGFGFVPLWGVVVGLITLGAGSVFYFQPITRQGAFAQGFGLLAVLMTTIPADLASGLEATFDDLQGFEQSANTSINGVEASLSNFNKPLIKNNIQLATYEQNEVRSVEIQSRRVSRYQVQITIVFPDGVPKNIQQMIRDGTVRGRLHNAETGATYNLFRSGGGDLDIRGDTLVLSAGVPARSDETTLWVRIECDKYKIEEQSATAKLGEALNWKIDLEKSSTPMIIQRLQKSFWF